ncbi:MAG: hypothetical protein CSA70_07080 [Rhodobacterales bacterium]|nr:MAG: hypothetical protein CSA70_07080 [Rhodobacterales bacterium]
MGIFMRPGKDRHGRKHGKSYGRAARWAVVASCLALAGCGGQKAKPPYRVLAASDATCAAPFSLGASNREKEALVKNPERYKCALQTHLLPGAERARAAVVEEIERARALVAATEATGEAGGQGVQGVRAGETGAGPTAGAPELARARALIERGGVPDTPWIRAARVAGQRLFHSDQYHLAYVEMNDAGVLDVKASGGGGQGGQKGTFQLDQLLSHLDANRRQGVQNYVIVYVHGWRHDAAIRDGDALKFRRMLGYTRAALNTRCVEQGRYCNAALTGVFLSWQGRVVDEGASDANTGQGMNTGFGAAAALATFENRWHKSCELGGSAHHCNAARPGRVAPVARVLRRVQGKLSLKPGDATRDKMMVVGHSMGGNMLATMLEPEAVKAVQRRRTTTQKRREMGPLLGDLVVLLNPAARARTWTSIQAAERKEAGLQNTNQITCQRIREEAGQTPGCKQAYQKRLDQWQRLYPVTQRPVYVSLTSTGDWGTLRRARRKVNSDSATGSVFPIAAIFGGASKRTDFIAPGHMVPQYANPYRLTGRAEGASHEMAVLSGATVGADRYPSVYRNATKPQLSWCAPADGWLWRIRTGEGKHPRGRRDKWDYGQISAPKPGSDDTGRIGGRNVGGANNKAAVQWRQVINTNRVKEARSVSPAHSPFWNARTLDTAIRGHAGWANYATWCAMNQLVLDDVTAPNSPPPEVETRLRQGQSIDDLTLEARSNQQAMEQSAVAALDGLARETGGN